MHKAMQVTAVCRLVSADTEDRGLVWTLGFDGGNPAAITDHSYAFRVEF